MTSKTCYTFLGVLLLVSPLILCIAWREGASKSPIHKGASMSYSTEQWDRSIATINASARKLRNGANIGSSRPVVILAGT